MAIHADGFSTPPFATRFGSPALTLSVLVFADSSHRRRCSSKQGYLRTPVAARLGACRRHALAQRSRRTHLCLKGGSYELRTNASVVGRGPDRDDHAVRGERRATIRGGPTPPCWSRAWRVPRAAPSAPVVRCTSPKAQPAGSRASIRRPGRSRRSPAVCRPSIVGIGGAIDVAFIGKTAYVLVTLVGPDVGGSDVVGIYRVDGPDSFTVVADIGEFSVAQSAEHSVRSSRPESSTRWKPTVAGSWSPMGTTTACCGSPSTARSPS